MDKRAILLIGHGSRTGNSSFVVEQTAHLMQEISRIPVQHCFLEFNSPTVPEGLRILSEQADIISVVPMLLASGIHTDKTIPHLLGMEEGKRETEYLRHGKPPVRICYSGEPIGAEQALAEILLKKAEVNFSA